MKKSTILNLGIAVVVAVLFAGGYAAHSRKDSLTVAQDSLRVAVQNADRQKSLVDFLTTRASLAEARADAEAARADSLKAAGHRTELRYVQVKATAPDSCAPVIAAADSAIAAAQAEAEAAENSRRAAQDAANEYRAGKDSALAALARLRAAGEAVLASSHPSLLERIRPRLVVAAVAGVNPITQRPAVVAGVGLGWSF